MEIPAEFFRNWFGHIVERAARLDQYLAERAAAAPPGAAATVDRLSSRVHELASSLYLRGAEIQAYDDAATEEFRSSIYAAAMKFAKTFSELHAHLTFIPKPWPSPALAYFLQEALSEGSSSSLTEFLSRHDWSILLTGDFNFSHIAMADSPSGIEADEAVFENAFYIPAAEKDNPLFWPNLVHEVGHLVAMRSGVTKAATSLGVLTDLSPETRRLLIHWAEDIAADLFAADLLGPAYFGAFVSFSVYCLPYSLRKSGASHPDARSRIEYLYEHLSAGPSEFEKTLLTPQQEAEVWPRLELDQSDVDERNKFFDFLGKKSDYPKPGTLRDFAKGIANLDEYQSVAPRSLKPADAPVVAQLAARLRTGELIATRRKKTKVADFDSEDSVRDGFVEARDQLEERPNEVRLILNAALKRKLSYFGDQSRSKNESPVSYLSGLLREYCKDPEATVAERLYRIRQEISGLDSVVSKSIEATGIISFYQSHER